MHTIGPNSRSWATAIVLLASIATVGGCGDDDATDNTADDSSDTSEDNDKSNDSDDAETSETDDTRLDDSDGTSDEPQSDAAADIHADAGTADGGNASTTTDEGTNGSDTTNTTGEEEGEAWFVVPSEIYAPDFATSTSYVPVVSSLDVNRIELDVAKELDGRASVAAIGDWLFVASSGEPIVSRYTINEDGSLEEAGALNFSNYGVPQWFSIDSWGGVFVNAEKAFIFNGSDGSHIIWNPSTMQITGEISGPGVGVDGYNLESIAVVRGNRMYRLFTALNYDTWEFLTDSQYLAVYDLDNDTLIDLIEETRCPQLYNRPFIDERGDIYWSGWVWTPGLTLTSDYPKSCALRVRNGEDEFDPEWQLNFADDVTGGREAGIMRYLGNGKALLDVFHDERVEIDADTDAQELSNTANWRLWTIDLDEKIGEPVDGLDFKAGGYTDVQVGNRTFLMVPNEDYSETTAYEVVDGAAVKGFEIQGSSYHMVRIAK
jgi:hypothetical protein